MATEPCKIKRLFPDINCGACANRTCEGAEPILRKKLARPQDPYAPSIINVDTHNAEVAKKFARQHQPAVLFVRVDHVKEVEPNKKQLGE